MTQLPTRVLMCIFYRYYTRNVKSRYVYFIIASFFLIGEKVVPSSRAEKPAVRKIEPVNENDDRCVNNGREATSPQSGSGGLAKVGSPDGNGPSDG